MSLFDVRREYEHEALHRRDLQADPFAQFRLWLDDALAADFVDATAMTLATATPDGEPSARVVLLKEVDDRGFVFFTNYGSEKGRVLAANPRAEVCFWWDRLSRQVRIRGRVERVSRDESERYFATRPLKSQIGAAASQQSQPIGRRAQLEQRFAELTQQYEGSPIPCPQQWGGYRLLPDRFEFWVGRRSRLHDRFVYRHDEQGQWTIERLSP